MDADLLVGGEVLNPWDETGDRTGEGDLLYPDDNVLNPVTYMESLLPACSACSD